MARSLDRSIARTIARPNTRPIARSIARRLLPRSLARSLTWCLDQSHDRETGHSRVRDRKPPSSKFPPGPILKICYRPCLLWIPLVQPARPIVRLPVGATVRPALRELTTKVYVLRAASLVVSSVLSLKLMCAFQANHNTCLRLNKTRGVVLVLWP